VRFAFNNVDKLTGKGMGGVHFYFGSSAEVWSVDEGPRMLSRRDMLPTHGFRVDDTDRALTINFRLPGDNMNLVGSNFDFSTKSNVHGIEHSVSINVNGTTIELEASHMVFSADRSDYMMRIFGVIRNSEGKPHYLVYAVGSSYAAFVDSFFNKSDGVQNIFFDDGVLRWEFLKPRSLDEKRFRKIRSAKEAIQRHALVDDDCPICLEALDVAAGNVVRLPRCDHAMHLECAKQSITSKDVCPLCRVPQGFTA
jgi:hypothetical protein